MCAKEQQSRCLLHSVWMIISMPFHKQGDDCSYKLLIKGLIECQLYLKYKTHLIDFVQNASDLKQDTNVGPLINR